MIQDGASEESYYPIEIVYGRGQFAGYTYCGQSETAAASENSFYTEDTFESINEKWKNTSCQSDSFVNQPVFKVIGAILIGMLLCLLNLKAVHGLYLHLLSGFMEGTELIWCTNISCYGVPACIGGIALMGICAYFWHDSQGVLFLILEVCSFVAGMIIIDLVIVMVVLAVVWILQFLKSILPVLISILFVILILKLIIGWLRRLF